ncbi:hypothetical protein H2203_006566 [Taxawa tesnikishii (nom. ined.)]|nr:hypothetical protein H2203_006566 [Dothideales sp. JES 119]
MARSRAPSQIEFDNSTIWKAKPSPIQSPTSKYAWFFSSLLGGRNPFIRRSSTAEPIAPSPELHAPTSYPDIQSPVPRKTHHDLSPNLEHRSHLDTSRGDHDAANMRSGFGRRETKAFATRRTTHAHEHGRFSAIGGQTSSVSLHSVPMCPRHGRRLVRRASGLGATTDGTERSISGAYVPVGIHIRGQVEATSPWAVPMKNAFLTKREGTILSPEICPDCLAEQKIKRRETLELLEERAAAVRQRDLQRESTRESDQTVLGPDDSRLPLSTAGTSRAGSMNSGSMTAQRGSTGPHSYTSHKSSLNFSDAGPRTDGSSSSSVELPLNRVGNVIAADLGEMLDAVIIEHRGVLDRVITNLKDGVPDNSKMQRLSRDVAQVSGTLASLQSGESRSIYSTEPTALQAYGRASMILDSPPHTLRERTRSVPDLLELIDVVGETIRLDFRQLSSYEGSDRSDQRTPEVERRPPPQHRSPESSRHRPESTTASRDTPAYHSRPIDVPSKDQSTRDTPSAIPILIRTKPTHRQTPSPVESIAQSFKTAHNTRSSSASSSLSEASLAAKTPATPVMPPSLMPSVRALTPRSDAGMDTALPSEVLHSKDLSPSPPITPVSWAKAPCASPSRTALRPASPRAPSLLPLLSSSTFTHNSFTPSSSTAPSTSVPPTRRGACPTPALARRGLSPSIEDRIRALSPPQQRMQSLVPGSVHDLQAMKGHGTVRPSDIVEQKRLARRNTERERAWKERMARQAELERRGEQGSGRVRGGGKVKGEDGRRDRPK